MENSLQPIFNVIESKKPTPLEQLANLRQAQEQLGLQGLEQQRKGITDTEAQIQQMQANAPDPRQQQITRALLAAGDLLSGSGGKASQLYQMFQPKDTSKQQTKLQQLLAQQRMNLSKSELGLLDQQLTGQIREQELALLGQKVAGANKPKPLNPLQQAKLGEIQAKAQEKKEAKEQASQTAKNVGQVLVRDIGMAKDIVDKSGHMATTLGGIPGLIPNTDANVLRKHIKSVKGNVAVDQLIQMKKQKVGLGQIPQSQLDMLSTLMGSLEADLPPEVLKQNLQDIEDIYADIVRKEGGDPFELYNKRMNKTTPTKPPANLQNFSPEAQGLAKELGL